MVGKDVCMYRTHISASSGPCCPCSVAELLREASMPVLLAVPQALVPELREATRANAYLMQGAGGRQQPWLPPDWHAAADM